MGVSGDLRKKAKRGRDLAPIRLGMKTKMFSSSSSSSTTLEGRTALPLPLARGFCAVDIVKSNVVFGSFPM
jgi:hypothetical protein